MSRNPPSDLAIEVHARTLAVFGEPDVRVEPDRPPDGCGRLDVLVWHPSARVPLTTFATVGLCDRVWPGVAHRVELHLARRGDLADREVEALAGCLVGFASSKRPLDRWHLLPTEDGVPTYPDARAVLLHPAFARDGWDHVHADVEVRILNVLPLHADESDLARTDLPELLRRLHALGPRMFDARDSVGGPGQE